MGLSTPLPSFFFFLDGWVKKDSIKLETVAKSFKKGEFNKHSITTNTFAICEMLEKKDWGMLKIGDKANYRKIRFTFCSTILISAEKHMNLFLKAPLSNIITG